MAPPTALLFDLDDTLIRAYANREAAWRDHLMAYAAVLPSHDVLQIADTISSCAARFWRHPDVYDCGGGHDLGAARRTIVGEAFAECAIDAPALAVEIADAFTAKRQKGYELYPDTVPVLTALWDSGIRLGLLTNGGRDSQRAKLDRFALASFFHFVGISEELGSAKPNAAIFHQALAALDSTAASTWMVGDHLEWDIAGAQAVGMVAVWFNPDAVAAPAHTKPDHVVTNLGQLPGLLRNTV